MAELEVLYEDNHIIAVNKPAGRLVQGDKTGDPPISEDIKNYLKKKYKKPGQVFLGVTHRIDRPTSGVVLFARTSKALERLNQMFQEKTIKKTYWAVVDNPPPQRQGVLVHFLKKNEKKNKSFAIKQPKVGGLRSELTYKLLVSSENYHLLEVKPITGRHHQIRVQLSAMGCHIRGDLKYGFPRTNPNGSIHLHAREISFEHPVKNEPITITANPVPDNLWRYFMENLPA